MAKDTKPQKSKDMHNYKFCVDVIEKILTRLPAKSICRFRCVSKEWLSLSSDPQFAKAHYSHAPVSGFFLVDDYWIRRATYFTLDGSQQSMIPEPSLSFLNIDDEQAMLDSSCNGLILCHRYPSYREYSCKFPFYVCNPMTKEYVVIYASGVGTTYVSLAFDPFLCPQFKIVAIGTMGHMSMHIFSSKTWSWKLLVEDLEVEFFDIYFDYKSTFWNGRLIWLGLDDTLLSLDMKSDQLSRLPSWTKFGLNCYNFEKCLFESKGHLYFIGKHASEDKLVLDVIMMESESFSWSLLYRIDLVVILNLYPEVKVSHVRVALAPVYFRRGVDGCDQLLLSIPRKILSYNIQDGKYTVVCDNVPVSQAIGNVKQYYTWCQFHPVAHNLCSLELFSNARITAQSTSKRFHFHAVVSNILNKLYNRSILLRDLISNDTGIIDKARLLDLIDTEILEETDSRKRENMKMVRYSDSVNYPVFLWPSKEVDV